MLYVKVHVLSGSVGTHAMSDAPGKLLRDGKIIVDMAGRALERNQFDVPRLRVPRETRGGSDDVAGSFETTRFFDERLHWKRVYPRDVLLTHHVHGHDQRVSGDGHASSKRRTQPSERQILRDHAGRFQAGTRSCRFEKHLEIRQSVVDPATTIFE